MAIPQYIIERLLSLDIEEVAMKLGIDVKKHKALCFIHDDHNPSITFSKAKNVYRCWSCGVGGDTIQLVQDKKNLNFFDACVWLASHFNISIPEYKSTKKQTKKVIRTVNFSKKNKDASGFDVEVFSWLIDNARLSDLAKRFLYKDRLLKDEVVRKMRIGSVNYPNKVIDSLIARFGEERCLNAGIIRKGEDGLYFYFYTPCLLFPYYEKNDELVGVQSRYLGDNKKSPRFQFISSQQTRMYNLPILNTLKRGDKLYISEGITDCLALLSTGFNAVAIPSATILPLEDLYMLRIYDLRMYPDNDEAGQRAFIKLRRFFLNNYSLLKPETLPEGVKDYSEYYISIYKTDGI